MFEAGQEFGGFAIVGPLGNRRAIENYQARRLASGAPVRLTILADELLKGEAARKKFVANATALCAIEHSGIARLLEVGQADGRAFYVSEFSPGGNFKQVIGTRLLPGRALRFLRDIARALEHLHATGVVHGNLKPGNILLGPDGRPILTDVGISLLLRLDYAHGIDPYYVSPEQVRGALPGTASDIYSLGIALYQMLCGKLPFQADNDFRIAMLRLDEPVPQLPTEYLFVQPLLERMLETEPQKRPTSSELLDELEPLIVEADAAVFAPGNLLDQQQGENLMAEKSDDKAAVDMTANIEKTLAEREQQRLDEPPVAIEITDPEQSSRTIPYFSYLLLLGVLVGAVLGAVLYFMLPAPESSGGSDRAQIELLSGLKEADLLLTAGEYNEARKAYLALISRYPESPRPYNNLASLYAAEGDLEQAQTLLKNALETAPDYLAIYRNIGTVYAAMARDSYGKALLLPGENKPVRLQILGQKAELPARVDLAKAQTVATVDAPKEGTAQSKESAQTVMNTSVEVSATDATSPAPKPVETAAAILIETQPEAVKSPAAAVVAPGDAAVNQALSPQQFLQRWAAAWSAQNVETYLTSYAQEYVPPNNLSRSDWEKKRRQRLQAPTFIEVSLEPVESMSGTGDTAVIQLVQVYRSDRYRDRTRKRFVLRRDGQSWLIVEERSLGRVR